MVVLQSDVDLCSIANENVDNITDVDVVSDTERTLDSSGEGFTKELFKKAVKVTESAAVSKLFNTTKINIGL